MIIVAINSQEELDQCIAIATTYGVVIVDRKYSNMLNLFVVVTTLEKIRKSVCIPERTFTPNCRIDDLETQLKISNL